MNRIRIGGLLILACIAIAACADSVVQPEGPVLSRDRVGNLSGPRMATGPARFICQTAMRVADERHSWRYGSVVVRFPVPEQAADGQTMTYRYEGYGSDGQLVSLATCRIPATSKAIRRMNQMLKVNTALGSTDLDAVTADYTLERMVVKTCGAEYTGEYPNCLPNPTPVEMGADGSSSGFWGSSYVPPPPPEPDEVDLSGDTVPAGVIS